MNAIEIRDLSKSYKDFNLEHMVRMAQERVRLSS